MSYLVLARKWRPQRFDDIAGQEHITRTLSNAIRSNRIAHAYLFTGVRGVGKTTAARILAKALNCEKGPTPDPCNQCTACEEITRGNCIDVLEIDGASNRGIDEIRQIIDNSRYQPAQCRFKIYVIDEVHQVTKDAFNALLKTLEEPPPSVKFILATTEPHRLPETILSRCQRYDFRRISLREIVRRLDEISRQEGLNVTEGALVLIAREAEGSMRDAQSLLEQVLACVEPSSERREETAVDERMLEEILGLAERQVLYDLSNSVIQENPRRCLELVANVVMVGRDLGRLSRDLVEHFRNLLVLRLIQDRGQTEDRDLRSSVPDQLLDLPDQEIEDLRRQVADLSIETLLDYFDFMAAGDEDVNRSSNPRFALETVLVRLATLPKTLPVAQLLERLEKLEKSLPESGKTPSAQAEGTQKPQVGASVAPAAVPFAGDREALWRSFVAFVGKERKFLASHLEGGTALELPPGRLRIGVTERLHLNYLQDAEHLSLLKNLAQRFFGNDVAVDITSAEAESAARKDEPAEAATVSPEDQGSPAVREALRIFGGSIKTVRRENS
ncbi:MAG TPA: DNA polymerase III subunit gamma/tau [Candidatus Binatia bacterium]|nr:DNA polymerase III subunit gamma/tau [Candidatus Binatia bacterium]